MKKFIDSLDEKKIVYIVAVASSLFSLLFDPSICFGIILGFGFCIANLKLVYKAMDDVFKRNGKMVFISRTSVLRFVLLGVFVYLGVWYAPYFHLLGITIGMVLGLVISIIDRKKVS